jgi:Ca-activated chloride channel homolog
MNAKSLLALAATFLALIAQAHGHGFIIIERPIIVPPPHHIPPPPIIRPIEIQSVRADVRIEGQIATTTIEQEFYNPNDRQLEGTFMFPVPKGANIDKFSMEVAGKMQEAELLPAEKARQIYEDIVRSRRDPALLEFAGRDLFRLRIFPIEARSRKPIKLVFTQLLRSDSGTMTYAYPLGAAKAAEGQAVKNFSLKLELRTEQPLAAVYSPSHKVEVKRDGAQRAVIGYESRDEKPEGDFQLVYSTEARDVGVSVVTHRADGEDGYFLLLAAPTLTTPDAKPQPKDVVFVLDTSGSMAGAKLEQAKKALAFCVENLNAEDRFELVRFSTEAEPLFDRLVDAGAANRGRASSFIRDLKPIGGTAIAAALDRALKLQPEKTDRPFVVIFLTDGLPTVGTRDPQEIIAGAKRAGAGVRIFSFGIGSDVNTQLLDQIAENTRAFSQYVLADEDIELKVSNFFTRIKEPALTNLRLEFSGGVRTSGMYPAELPDLFKGDQLVLTGRYSGAAEVEARLTGTAAGREQTFTYKVRFEERSTSHDFVPRLWATRRVGFLLDEIRTRGETKEVRDEATELARKFGIVTPYTAYLVVEDEERRNVPMAQRSLQEMAKDRRSRDVAASAWSSFKSKHEGEDGVANARSQNAFKYADQAPAAIAGGASEARRATVTAAAPPPAEAARLTSYTQQARWVNGRAFYQNGTQWVDAEAQRATKRQQVQFGSDSYFELLKKHPEAAAWLALGDNVLIALNDTVYEIAP